MARVIFDLDGTLVDSAPDIHAALNRLLSEEGEAGLSAAEVRSFIGNGVPALIECVIHARGRAGEEALHPRWQERFLHHYAAAPAELTRPYPGVIDALASLSRDGHALGICTNKPEAPARAVLRAFALDRFFPVVIGGDTLPRRKPDPAPLLAATAALGGGPTVLVGDSEVDAATAVSAGVPFVLFTEGYRKSPVESLPQAARFSSFAALPPILARFFARDRFSARRL